MLLAESAQFVKGVQWRKHVTAICDVSFGKAFSDYNYGNFILSLKYQYYFVMCGIWKCLSKVSCIPLLAVI